MLGYADIRKRRIQKKNANKTRLFFPSLRVLSPPYFSSLLFITRKKKEERRKMRFEERLRKCTKRENISFQLPEEETTG